MKLWIRCFKKEKLILNEMIVNALPLTKQSLSTALTDLCDKFDLPCPIVTDTNVNNLNSFNHTKFKQADFLEKIAFDVLEVANIPK